MEVRAGRRPTSGVDRALQPAKRCDGGVYHSADILFGADIAVECASLAAIADNLGAHAVRCILAQIGDQQPAAAFSEQQRRSPADAATPARSEEHTSELQSLMRISSAVFCLKKKKQQPTKTP